MPEGQHPWEEQARRVVAGWPPLTDKKRAEITLLARQSAARRARDDPLRQARRRQELESRAELRRACEHYLADEISLSTLVRRLRRLERES